MEMVPYDIIPRFIELSSVGRARANLIMQEYREKTIEFSHKVRIGDIFGLVDSQVSSCYIVRKIQRPSSLLEVNLGKMNRGGKFMVVCRTKQNTLRLIELSLVL